MRSLKLIIFGQWFAVIVIIVAFILGILYLFVPFIEGIFEVVPALQERKEFLDRLAELIGK